MADKSSFEANVMLVCGVNILDSDELQSRDGGVK